MDAMTWAQPAVPGVCAGSMLLNCWRHLAAWRCVQSDWRSKPARTSTGHTPQQVNRDHISTQHSSSQPQPQPPRAGEGVWDMSAGHALLLHTEQQLVSCLAQQVAGLAAAALLLYHRELLAAGAAAAAAAAQEWLVPTVEWLAGGTPGGGRGTGLEEAAVLALFQDTVPLDGCRTQPPRWLHHYSAFGRMLP
jgi:hypothetical protein